MKKRTFLKTTSAIMAGSVFTPMIACKESKPGLKNWAKNLTYSTNNIHHPTSLEEVQTLVAKLPSLKGLGSRHSFNTIADSKHQLVSLKNMKKVVSLDKTGRKVTVEAGSRYGDICEYLERQGFALHNMASLPHISIAGAGATATHGSGVNNQALSSGISAVEIVKADGEVVNLSREKNGEQFYGAVVGVGALGVVTKVTLDLFPTYKMQQIVYRNIPMSSLENDFDTIMSSGYSVSLFTDWRNKNINEVWIKSRTDATESVSGNEYYGGTLADRHLHPVESQSAESCTEQMGIEGAWYERLPHFKMEFTPSSGEELQAEYFVPMEYGYKAVMAVESLNEKISPHLYISEVRTIAEDNHWMSPAYKKPCVSIHFTFKPQWEAVQKILPLIEQVLDPYFVRPHWGKLFTMAPFVLHSRIEKLTQFRELAQDFDPDGKFRNDFLRKNVF
ncbi:FAD-binding protein [Fulvivirgaceae bacterium BMA12]|uniref:FAD-binding protein n=1 Tax=Agaribacillus aureus TaxID=3051825 RepID=A0ABT8L6P0_9BACT|nr:FAD-binding protein [Fulvivirgaceae bacterium BMA12]